MKKHSAFSLLELSVVILIIGVLIAGVTQGSVMLKKSRLNSARSLTKSSAVAGIANLMLWYETSLETSFDSSAQFDGASVGTWYDNNPQSSVKINATQTVTTPSDYRPKFYENVFNGGIPAVRFDGTDDYLSFDGSLLVASDYTVFVVEQRRATVDNNRYFLSGITAVASTDNTNLYFGYATNTGVRLSQSGSSNSYNVNYNSIPAYTTTIPRIHTGQLKVGTKKSYWLNGGVTAEASSVSANYVKALTSYTNASLGRYTITSTSFSRYFNGDIAEIIIFTRALSTEERQSVETYLSKKYVISLS